jgi:3',5'-cyclic AMP phosphodiesterase CpdA
LLLEHARRLEVDHIVITGDIAADAEKADFHLARKLLLAQGLLESPRLSVVIGNHDVYGGVHTAEDILDFPRRCRKTNMQNKVEEFHEAFRESFEGAQFATGKSPFPYVKPLGDILLIGLNSVAPHSVLKNPVGSNGMVDDRQQHQLDRMLSSPQWNRSRKIVLIHHHFNKMEHVTDGTMQSAWKAFEQQTMKLRGKRMLLKLFQKHRVDAILHGHYHENGEYARNGLRFINGGGSILTPHSSELHLHLLHIDAKEIRVQEHRFPLVTEHAVGRISENEPFITSHVAA